MAQLPKGGLVRANNKPVHGSCATYFPAGVVDVWTFKTRDGSRDPDIKSTLLARPKDGLPWGNVCAVASPGTPRHLAARDPHPGFSDVVWVKLGWWFQSDIFRFFSPRTLGEDEAILTCAYFSGWNSTTNQEGLRLSQCIWWNLGGMDPVKHQGLRKWSTQFQGAKNTGLPPSMCWLSCGE